MRSDVVAQHKMWIAWYLDRTWTVVNAGQSRVFSHHVRPLNKGGFVPGPTYDVQAYRQSATASGIRQRHDDTSDQQKTDDESHLFLIRTITSSVVHVDCIE
jgi:hypothetical protein